MWYRDLFAHPVARTLCGVCNVQALRALYGLALCFFGGIFANTIAAVEAFKQSGYERARTCFHDLRVAAAEVYAANVQDNLRDDNHDGVADVDQINKRELLSRKMVLLIRTVDPTVLQQAFIGLYQGLIGVLATLKFKFAKSVALGLSIGNMAKRPLAVILAPTLKNILKPGNNCQRFELYAQCHNDSSSFWLFSACRAFRTCFQGNSQIVMLLVPIGAFARLLCFGCRRGLQEMVADDRQLHKQVGCDDNCVRPAVPRLCNSVGSNGRADICSVVVAAGS